MVSVGRIGRDNHHKKSMSQLCRQGYSGTVLDSLTINTVLPSSLGSSLANPSPQMSGNETMTWSLSSNFIAINRPHRLTKAHCVSFSSFVTYKTYQTQCAIRLPEIKVQHPEKGPGKHAELDPVQTGELCNTPNDPPPPPDPDEPVETSEC